VEQKDIFSTVKDGNTTLLEIQLKTVDINTTDEDGKTLLHLACEYARLDIARVLLQSGIDKNIRDHDGRDALNYAKLSGNKKIIDLLQENDASK